MHDDPTALQTRPDYIGPEAVTFQIITHDYNEVGKIIKIGRRNPTYLWYSGKTGPDGETIHYADFGVSLEDCARRCAAWLYTEPEPVIEVPNVRQITVDRLVALLTDGRVEDVSDRVSAIDDIGVLEAIKETDDRKTVQRAVDARLTELAEEG